MGKSIEVLALTLSAPRPSNTPGTLVLCPVTLLSNWEIECNNCLPDTMSVLVVNSSNKTKTKPADMQKCSSPT